MGYLVANRLPDTYEARAQLLVGPLSADKDALDAAGAQARTYAALATTAPILDSTAERVGLTSVRSKIASVNASDVTRLIAITARDGDSVRAAAIANALAGVLVAKAASGPPEGRMSIVERATPPDNPVGPSTALIVVLTAVVGLLGAFGIAALVDSMTNVMRSEDDLAAFAPVLGSVNGSPAWRRSKPLVVEDDPDSPAAASYRVLTTKIELSNGEGPLRSLLLVDAHGGHSSARVAANVAAGFAEDGTRVVIIDGDEREGLMLCEKIREAAFVVPISQYNRDLMLEECGEGAREKLVVIHCGVDTEFFRPRGAMVDDGRLEILSVGTLHEVKGQRYLVEACRLLRDEGVDVSCKLVGDGPDRKALTGQIAAAGLGDRVVLLGRRDRDGVCELLRSADVLAAPSVPTKQGKREGIPIVLMSFPMAPSSRQPFFTAPRSWMPTGSDGVTCQASEFDVCATGLVRSPQYRRKPSQNVARRSRSPV